MIFDVTFLSLKVSILSMFICVISAFFIAEFLQGKKEKKYRFLESILNFSLFFPPTTIGYFLLIILGRNSFIGRFMMSYGITMIFNWKGAVLACIIITFPVAYRSIKTGLLEIDPMYLEVAKEMGASRWQKYYYVLFPLIKKNIGGALILSFGRSFGEFGASLIVAGNIPGKTQTIPMAIYYSMEQGNNQSAYILIFIVFIISATMMHLYNKYWGV